MWLIANIAEAGELALSQDGSADLAKQQLQEWGWNGIEKYTGTDRRTLEGIKKRTYRAAGALQRMEATNKVVAQQAQPLPTDRTSPRKLC